MTKQKYIYVVLIKAKTGLGKFCRVFNQYEYTHIAVSLDRTMDDFVTFSRKFHYAPFCAGFMHEKREHYAFGSHKATKVKVYRLPVSEENYKKICTYVKRIESDEAYVFNFYGMLTMPFLHGLRIYKAHNCMSFVGKIIELSEAVEMEKPFYRYNIPETDRLLQAFPSRVFALKKKKNDSFYMQKIGFTENIKFCIRLNVQLVYRIIFKRNEYYE